MTVVDIEDLFYPASVSLLGALQLARFARRVGEARGKYKIPVPKTDGDPNFTRIFRAQQNNLEFYPIFLTLLWTSSIFLHHAVPSVFGLIYLYARHKYFYGYSEAGEKRLPGFHLALKMLMILLILSVAGLVSTGYTKHTGEKIDVSFYQKRALEYGKPAIDRANATYKWICKTSEPYVESTRNHIGKVMEKISDSVQELVKLLQVYTKVAYSHVSIFAHRAAEKLVEVYTLLAEYFSTFRNKYISTYFQQPAKKEL